MNKCHAEGRKNFNTVTLKLVLKSKRCRLAEPVDYTVEISAGKCLVNKTVIIQE